MRLTVTYTGEENFFLFGLTAQQVADSRGWYDPHWHYQHEPAVFDPIRHALLDGGDFYRHLADLSDYARAHRDLDKCYADPAAWNARAIRNVACSGKFSSDRTILEYARQIWNLEVSPVSP